MSRQRVSLFEYYLGDAKFYNGLCSRVANLVVIALTLSLRSQRSPLPAGLQGELQHTFATRLIFLHSIAESTPPVTLLELCFPCTGSVPVKRKPQSVSTAVLIQLVLHALLLIRIIFGVATCLLLNLGSAFRMALRLLDAAQPSKKFTCQICMQRFHGALVCHMLVPILIRSSRRQQIGSFLNKLARLSERSCVDFILDFICEAYFDPLTPHVRVPFHSISLKQSQLSTLAGRL
jgi:hypothetical protein